ncbi:MAG: GAF domain-containing protein, partial [Bdellovibrionales bacterium]|nr:GAF domain-containing protein [Bdellovibrionales bacterium]
VLAEEEGIRSAVLVPITGEDEVVGTLALFSRALNRFGGGDVMLVSAAASQIGLASRQADLFRAYQQKARNLAALYRVSHELSRHLTMDDIFHAAFTTVREELGLKRLWLGLLNETGTRIVGQAAYGPGIKRRLAEINIDLTGAEHPLAQVIRSRRPLIVEDAENQLRAFGIQRIFSRLEIDQVVVVPLVSGGQVVGLLVVQPSESDDLLGDESLTLLRSLAAEIATAILARRLEERVAEGEKMRTAGLLAAGIAHNFNNLLQAILGQASLLEMQADSPEKVMRASHFIHEAATKGASMVRQLMSFAQLEQPRREPLDINALVEASVRAAADIAAQPRIVKQRLTKAAPRVLVDGGQFRQILTNILLNAYDASGPDEAILVSTDALTVDQHSPLFEVPYGEYVRITIQDSGHGMDEETRTRCLEPFYTTKNVDPGSGLGMSGSGLGLAAAYALTRRNGGNLVLESRPGEGTTVTLYLPVSQQRPESSGDMSKMLTGADRPELRVVGRSSEEEGGGSGAPMPAESGKMISLAERIERYSREERVRPLAAASEETGAPNGERAADAEKSPRDPGPGSPRKRRQR